MRQRARWVILFLVFIVAATFSVRMVRQHPRAPQPPPEQHAGVVAPGGAMLASLAPVVDLDSAIDVTAETAPPTAPPRPPVAPAPALASGSIVAAPATQPAVARAPASAPAEGKPAVGPSRSEDVGGEAEAVEAEAEAAAGEEAAPAAEAESAGLGLPLVDVAGGYAGPRFRPLEPPPSYEGPVGAGAGIGTVRETIGVDPLPGERSPLGAGQSHLGVTARP